MARRLALEVAAQLAVEFPDSVWVFELAAVTDPASVPDAVAAVVGITQQPGKTVSESVAAALEGRSRLLVFDNCEHDLVAAADLIEAILARSLTVKILATSRECLRVADEQLWPVRRSEADAAAMRAALMAHDEVLRSSIEAHDGFLFSRTGDGVAAAFASPTSAVDCPLVRSERLRGDTGPG